jgi:hypothetical protein
MDPMTYAPALMARMMLALIELCDGTVHSRMG